MQDAVLRYRKRRQKRLDAKAVELYKLRRDERLLSRFDDEENGNENNVGGKHGGGHGNTRIPFGLCQREGIRIDPSWTPKDAWDALAGKGYSAGDVYKELQKTGKVGKKSTPKKEPTKLTEAHFPQGMLGSSKKNTMEFAKYINEHCDDANISEFLSLGNSPKAKSTANFKCKKLKKPYGAQVAYRFAYGTDELREIEVSIPLITSTKDASIKAAQVRTFAHEWTHVIDLVSRTNGTKYYSETFAKLNDAIDANDALSIGKEAKEKIDAFNAKYDEETEALKRNVRDMRKQVAVEMFGETHPEWLKDGTFSHWECTSYKAAEEYEKQCKKRAKELDDASSQKKRAIMDGVSNLQGIYDSISAGQLRAKGTVRYGHSLIYFSRNKGNRNLEALADYVALRATNPQLAQIFINDKPEIAKAMDETIASIAKHLGGA